MRHYSREEWSRVFDHILGERIPGGSDQDILEESATKRFVIGAHKLLEDGRAFRYAYASTLLTAYWGALTYMPTTEHGVLTANVAIGDRVLHCTSVAAITANQFKGGYVVLSWNPGFHRILGNTAAGAGVAFTITLERPVWRAFTVATDCTIYPNEYDDVRAAHNVPAHQGHSTFVGVPLFDVTAARYIWLQTWGPCVGMGVAAQGAAVGERAVYFYGDGALINQTEMVAGPGQALQYAGELLPYTGPAGAPVDVTNAMIFYNLRIKP